VRKYWVFVPAQYAPEKPACVLVFQDGQRAVKPDGVLCVPQVLENLIAKNEIPVTIGIFITPGSRGEEYSETGGGNPNNRAAEYDALGDAYARFVVEEMLPEVGKTYNLTKDPEGRAIGGASSGAICAFTVAWERPDEFRKVISLIGSYTAIGYRPARDGQPVVPGGDLYPTLIRKGPIKPLTVFLQDGSRDLDNEHGTGSSRINRCSPRSNGPTPMPTAGSRGAEVPDHHDWGTDGHSDRHGGAISPTSFAGSGATIRSELGAWPREAFSKPRPGTATSTLPADPCRAS
jgi:enterochelin esterase family protein